MSSTEGLCCCEYINEKGEQSHILATCCDCEALDTAFDRCITCRKVPNEVCDKMMSTISDRIRIPSCSGSGAVRVKLDIIMPVLVVIIGLLLAAQSFYWTVFSLVTMATGTSLSYRAWLKKKHKERTRVFYILGLTSAIFMYVIFESIVISFREILLWENLLLSTMVGLMFYNLYYAKGDPGYTKMGHPDEKEADAYDNAGQRSQDFKVDVEGDVLQNPVGSTLVQNFGFDAQEMTEKIGSKAKHLSQGPRIPSENVVWVDSRPVADGLLVTWCSECYASRRPRSGHCPLCARCIEGRDHHCVWIDNCVGARNHRAFFMALLLLVITGFYGAHLTLTTVCTPEIYFDWFLFPSDCRFIYTDYMTSLCFVAAIYTILLSAVMSLILLQQVILISQNLTGQELARAAQNKWIHVCVFVNNNLNNRGFRRNWRDFLLNRRSQQYPGVPS